MLSMRLRAITYAIASAAVVSACLAAPCLADIGIVSYPEKTVSRYETVEISAEVSADYDNPYDPAQIEVSTVVTTPSGKKMTVPSFYSGSGNTWITRFTPVESGKYTFSISMKSGENSSASQPHTIDVSEGSGDGFVRKCGKNPYYLAFDSGKPFFGLGHNIAWAPEERTYAFEKYFSLFKDNGCNLTRIWMNVPWGLPFELKKLGRYDTASAKKVDAIIKLAEEYGVYIVLVLDSYSSLMAESGSWGEDSWKTNPYNAARGGPCQKPWDFFSDETAKRSYKNRLRYIMARWGYSPNILAFELWNELDSPPGWVDEMVSCIRSVNPHNQLVTTSLGYPWANNFNEPTVWGLNSMDFIDYHIYGDQAGDAIGTLVSVGAEITKRFNKGLLVGEFGMNAARSDDYFDPEGNGYELHNSIWAAAMSGSFAGALNWWWEEYVKPKNLYPHYRALRNFVNGVNWAASRVERLRTGPVTLYAGENKIAEYSDVAIPTKELWENTAYREFTVGNDGSVSGGIVNAYLQGTIKKDPVKIDPVFHVNYPADGKFIIKVGMVSQGGRLIAYVDGEKVLEQEFPAGQGEGPWIKSTFRPDYKIYQCLYNTEVEIPVTKGAHTIKLTNTGIDWIGIKNIRLSNYTSNLFLNSRVVGLTLDSEMLVWIQNKKPDGESVADASVTIENAGDLTYSIEWWDTFEGKILSTVNVRAENGGLTLHIPPFTRDIACKIRK